MMDLTETQPPGGLSAELRAADGWVPAGCSACGKGLGPRPPSSRPRGLQGVGGTSHMAISASPSHTWEQCSARRPRDSGRRACPPFWATLEHATSVKAPGLLRAQARAAACSGAPDLEGFPERQPHPRFSPPQIFGFLVCMGVILAIGNAIWEHEVGARFQVYLPWDEAVDSAFFSGFLSFWSYIIILNTVVPISLYVRCVPSPPSSPRSPGGPLASAPRPRRRNPREAAARRPLLPVP